jgi:hypothetical protein
MEMVTLMYVGLLYVILLGFLMAVTLLVIGCIFGLVWNKCPRYRGTTVLIVGLMVAGLAIAPATIRSAVLDQWLRIMFYVIPSPRKVLGLVFGK